MKNLAGHQECDEDVERELVRCRIDIIRDQPREWEVPSSLRGKLGSFTFFRASCYWIVRGPLPLAVAKELYGDPVGCTDIRINGDCGCPAPGEPGGKIVWRDHETKKILMPYKEWDELQVLIGRNPHMFSSAINDEYAPSDDPSMGQGFIESYHIDTEVGLRLFADTLKKHGL